MVEMTRSEANEIRRLLARQHADSMETKALLHTLVDSVGDQRGANGDHVTLVVLGERLDATNARLDEIKASQRDGCPALVEPTGRIQSLEQWRGDTADPALDKLGNFRIKMLTLGLGSG